MDNKVLSIVTALGFIALVVVIGAKSFTADVNVNQPNQSVPSYAGIGQNQSFAISFDSGLFQGGRVASSTTSNAGTLLASSIENATVIDYTLNLSDVTLTLPATSTIGFMRNPGDTKVFYVRNATTTATMDITFAGGTGMNYKKATSTKILVGDTDGSNSARITLIRKANTDIDAIVDLFVD